jgi:hypothetical protein
MADTDKLRNYSRTEPPTIDGNDRRFLLSELQKIQTSLALLVTVCKQLEARLVAGGL